MIISDGSKTNNKVPMPGLDISQAYMRYKNKTIFKNLSLSLPGGQWTCLLGTSGVGKSTLLRMIAGVLTDDDFKKESDECCIGNITASDGISLKGRVAYMAQSDLLMPWCSALENVLLGCKLRGQKTRKNIEKAKGLLNMVELEDSAKLKPSSLSGGMRQRVALARTLMENKPIVLMDEPFSALDAITRYKLRNLAAKLLKNCTVLLVTHDPMEALRLGDNIKIMCGSPAKIIDFGDIPKTPIPRNSDDMAVIALYGKVLKIMEAKV
jgi:putative hydroxymethylpyrimidine transport system ATP-binding protein